MDAIARVALDLPVREPFDYLAPNITAQDVGKLVVVPFGRGHKTGLIVELGATSVVAANKLKPIDRILPEVQLGTRDLDVLKFCSDYYHHPLGQTIFTAVAPALRRAVRRAQTPVSAYSLSKAGKSVKLDELPNRQLGARRLLAHLQEVPFASTAELSALGDAARRALRAFVAKGWVEPAAAVPTLTNPSLAPQLTAEQRHAVESICAKLGAYGVWQLHGVTGSGKTEVYQAVIEAALAAKRQALLLIPEINLTPKIEIHFRSRFPAAQIVCLHSSVSDAQRAQHFLAAQRGEADIVIGTRLAVFTPLPRLGLIVVDEEHDASYKQNDGLRYSARDVAVYRAKQCDVPVVLGSATPSLESYLHARSGRYALLPLRHRAQAQAQLPSVRLINMRGERNAVSVDVLGALRQRLQRGEQSLVFINRRGFAPVLYCADCGWVCECTRCSARMVLHTREARLRCHHCGRVSAPPDACPNCAAAELLPLGRGTQRVEALLAEHLPQARVLRVDRDSMAQKGAWSKALQKIEQHDVDILVGTQMLAKGHDFERLTLAVLLDVDQALFSTDFRAAERLFSLIVQVAGRAGRAQLPGEVLIQTQFVDHPLFRAALTQDFEAFAEAELAQREATGFPPYVHQAVLRAEALDERALLRFMQTAAQHARSIQPKVTVYDPIAPPVAKVAGKSRLHLLVQSAARGPLQRFLRVWDEFLQSHDNRRVRWTIDVDPLDF